MGAEGKNPSTDERLIDLAMRVAKLEQQVNDISHDLQNIEEALKRIYSRFDKIDNRLWALLSGVILTILLEILLKIL